MANFLIKIDYRKSPFYKDLPEIEIRTSGHALEQYLFFGGMDTQPKVISFIF